MRLSSVIAVAIALFLPAAGLAQPPLPQAPASLAEAERGSGEWVEYKSLEDRFTANFPGQPTVTQTTYKSQYGVELPARVYNATLRAGRYMLTVVDYSRVEPLLAEKAKSCPPAAETCLGSATSDSTGVGNWRVDYNGAIAYAIRSFVLSDSKVTEFLWANPDLVSGQLIQMIAHDGSRTFAAIYMHEQRLYIIKATVPSAYPEPSLFTQSLEWLDEKGNSIRYRSVYHHSFPPPPRSR